MLSMYCYLFSHSMCMIQGLLQHTQMYVYAYLRIRMRSSRLSGCYLAVSLQFSLTFKEPRLEVAWNFNTLLVLLPCIPCYFPLFFIISRWFVSLAHTSKSFSWLFRSIMQNICSRSLACFVVLTLKTCVFYQLALTAAVNILSKCIYV